MPDYQYLVLDSYPLTNAAVPSAREGAAPNHSQQCQQWMADCEAAGKIILVPAIAYYEGVRDMFQRRATAQIARFQSNCFHPKRFIELDADHLTKAAKRWGDLRRSGLATSDPKALDGDAILAAQILSLNLPASEFVVATRNPDHIARLACRSKSGKTSSSDVISLTLPADIPANKLGSLASLAKQKRPCMFPCKVPFAAENPPFLGAQTDLTSTFAQPVRLVLPRRAYCNPGGIDLIAVVPSFRRGPRSLPKALPQNSGTPELKS